MKNVLWLSRHPMTNDQKADLSLLLGGEELIVNHVNVVWMATSDMVNDSLLNQEKWAELKQSNPDSIIAGVFPPVALECRQDGILYTPVSVQGERNHEGVIPFVHARWACI